MWSEILKALFFKSFVNLFNFRPSFQTFKSVSTCGEVGQWNNYKSLQTEFLQVGVTTGMGDSAYRLRGQQWPVPVQPECTESSGGPLCPSSPRSLNSSHTKDIVIPPLITRWSPVCADASLPCALTPTDKVLSGYDCYETVWWTTGPKASPDFPLQAT